MLLLFGFVKLVAESTCTSMDARDVSNARLHEKGKGSNGIYFLERVTACLHWVLLS